MRMMRYSIFRHSNRPVVPSFTGSMRIGRLVDAEKDQRHGGVDLDTGWYSQVISWFIYHRKMMENDGK